MERFQKIKGNRRKLDVSSICRFCGLENDERYSILNLNEDGVDFATKISNMIGINVHSKDSMPQNVCFICMDKINDFYEFRLMALNTEKQTREALGLPLVEEKPKPKITQIIETKPAVVRLVDLKYSLEDKILIDRALGRLKKPTENIPIKRLAPAPTATITSQPPAKKTRKDISCNICTDAYFSYTSDLQDHQIKEHLPLISKYACGSCRETFEQLSDFKEHLSMHTKKKLLYYCYFCSTSFTKQKDFQKHMTNYNCKQKVKLQVKYEDIKCFLCKKKYLTQNLFEWHGCFLKTRGSCMKCRQYIPKKKALLKHYVLCEGEFVTPEAALDPNRKFKSEMTSPTQGSVVRVTQGVRKKTVPQRRMTTIKSEKEINLIAASVAPHGNNEEEEEYPNYEDDITYDNFGSDDDDDDDGSSTGPNLTNLEPVVELREPRPRIINIKSEMSDGQLAIRQHTVAGSDSTLDPQLIRSIKKEQSASGKQPTIVTTNKQQISPALRIKAERGVNEQPVVQVLNPFSTPTTQLLEQVTTAARKKVFKLPPGLAAKIKKEKMNADYGDGITATGLRDEAEPDPEEEAQMERDQASSPVIKQERIDSSFGCVQVTPAMKKKTKGAKQLINPMALAMMREKKAIANGSENGGGNSLVIAAVNSLVIPSTNGGDEFQTNVSKELTATLQTHESKSCFASNTAVGGVESSSSNSVQDSQMLMVEIPAEFSTQNISPAVVTVTPNDENELSSIVSVKEKDNEAETTTTMTDNTTSAAVEAMNTNDDDELNQLLENLEKYGGDDITVGDSDLQDLLKFD